MKLVYMFIIYILIAPAYLLQELLKKASELTYMISPRAGNWLYNQFVSPYRKENCYVLILSTAVLFYSGLTYLLVK